jgi:hypothetical protein
MLQSHVVTQHCIKRSKDIWFKWALISAHSSHQWLSVLRLYSVLNNLQQLEEWELVGETHTLSLSLSLSMALQPFGPWPLFQFLNPIQSVGLLGWGISPSQGHYLHTEKRKHSIIAQTPMPPIGFEPTIPVFKQAETVHAFDHEATAISRETHIPRENLPCSQFVDHKSHMIWPGTEHGPLWWDAESYGMATMRCQYCANFSHHRSVITRLITGHTYLLLVLQWTHAQIQYVALVSALSLHMQPVSLVVSGITNS